MGFGHTKWKKLLTMSELSKQTKTNILGTHEGKIVKKVGTENSAIASVSLGHHKYQRG